MIKSNDISVIVQGAINKEETPKCLRSLRKYLPNAEIILSTWEGSNASELEDMYDILLLNKDPGAGYYYKTETTVKYNNLNRQLVSTQEGLKKATRKYAMKLRSDLILTSDKFLKYFDYYPKRDEKYSLFNHKILVSTIFSRFSYNDYELKNRFPEIKLLFHVSDWWFFGLKEDIEQYFDIPLVKEPEFSNYYKLDENKNKFNPYNYFEESYVRFSPEQYFALECFKNKFNNIKIEHAGDINEENIEQSRKYLINNFIFLEFSETGIYSNKYLISKYHKLSPTYLDLYNKFRQKYEYKKYCDFDFKTSKMVGDALNNKFFKQNFIKLFTHIQTIRKNLMGNKK